MLKDNIEAEAARLGVTPDQLCIAIQNVALGEQWDGPTYTRVHWASVNLAVAGVTFMEVQESVQKHIEREMAEQNKTTTTAIPVPAPEEDPKSLIERLIEKAKYKIA